jgi:hypothetical protein
MKILIAGAMCLSSKDGGAGAIQKLAVCTKIYHELFDDLPLFISHQARPTSSFSIAATRTFAISVCSL